MTFGFFVDAGYQAAESDLVLPSYNQYFINSEPTDFTIDPVAVNTAKAAAAYAQSIVDTYKNGTNLEKLTAYKNEICNLVSYDDDARNGLANDMNPWQLVSVFDQDPSTNVVCEGYSKAFQYLCELSDFSGGIVSRLATGTMDGGTGAGAHMWNIVHMDDGKNYLVDVTNCDTGTIGADDLLFLKGAAGGDTASGYYYNCHGSNIYFIYDEDTLDSFTPEERTLSMEDYDPSAVPEPVIHIITFDGNGSDMVSEPSRNIEEGEPYGELPEAERTGYRFLGWFTQPEGGETITAATICTGDATVYAHWIRTYWIFFERE